MDSRCGGSCVAFRTENRETLANEEIGRSDPSARVSCTPKPISEARV
jgi:hypothetical protein